MVFQISINSMKAIMQQFNKIDRFVSSKHTNLRLFFHHVMTSSEWKLFSFPKIICIFYKNQNIPVFLCNGQMVSYTVAHLLGNIFLCIHAKIHCALIKNASVFRMKMIDG